MRSIAIALLSVCAAIPAIAGERRPDTCQRQIPASLIATIAVKFPGYRAPLETDNLPQDIRNNRNHGGNGCLGVAHGDFFGGGAKSFVLGLTTLKGQSGLVVVARAVKDGWSFQQLGPSWENFRSRLYIDIERPGKYERTLSLYSPLDSGEAQSMRCPHQGIGFGETESTEIVYCFIGTKWRHVQISD